MSRTPEEAALFGRREVEPEEELWAEADDVAEVVGRLEDSWEDDAEIRDVATGRFIDRDKIHQVDFTGPRFSVSGASITPRSPQGRPPVVVRADSPAALRVAARRADLLRIAARDAAAAVRQLTALRGLVEQAGRDRQQVAVLVEVVAWLGADAADWRAQLDRWTPTPFDTVEYVGDSAGLADLIAVWTTVVDGVVVRPAVLPTDLDALVDEVVPLLRERGVRPAGPPGPTLRDTLGLPRPASHYAMTPIAGTAGATR